MSAFAALSLNDRVPVAVTFNPAGDSSGGVYKWLDNATVFDGKRSVSMSVTMPKPGGSVIRCKQKVVIPHLDGDGKKIGESYATVEYVVSKLASQNDRLDLRAFTQNLTANAVTTAFVTSFEGIY